MHATSVTAPAAAQRLRAPAGSANQRRRPPIRLPLRCASTVSEERAGAERQAAGAAPPGGNGASGGAALRAAPAPSSLPQLPKLPVNETVCMEGEALRGRLHRPALYGRLGAGFGAVRRHEA